MDIYFNELSILPASNNSIEGKQKILMLLETMKALRAYDFNILRTNDNFYGEDFGSGYTISSFINDSEIRSDIKLLLRSIVKNPFIEDVGSTEAEQYILNKFDTKNHLDVFVSPEGIAASYVYEKPTISISSFPLWDKDSLILRVTDQFNGNIFDQNIINISNPQGVNNKNFLDWIKSLTIDVQLNSHDNIVKLFPEKDYQFDARAISEIIAWFYDDKRYIVRIKNLIEDIRKSPFVGGIGLTENLGGGKGSKRIVKKDRVVYTVLDNKIIIHSCKKHYDDK